MDQSSSEPCGVGDHNGVQGLNSKIKSLQISSDSTNNNAEAWKRWWQQLELYLLATGLDKAPEKRKIAILLHLIGEKGLNIFNTFNLTIEKTTLAEVKSKFQNFFEPRRNITMCRHMFFTRKQQKSESIEGFLADLENKSQDCEFGTLRESLIRDIFIANLHMDLAHVRQRLLQEPDLTYQKMRELATTLIVAQQDAEKIVSSSNVEKSENVMHLRRRSRSRGDRRQRASPVGQQGSGAGKSPNPERRSRTCSRCGQSHRYKCPAQGVKCRSCKSFGHFAKYCFKNKNISHLESFNSSHSHNNNQDYFVGILNSHSSSQSHKSNCHLKSYNSHYKHVKSASTQSPPPQFTYIHSQSQSGNDSGDDIGVIPERSHRDSYCQSEKLILKSYFNDDNGDNVMSERSEKYLGDESSHQSEKSILKSYCHNSNKSCDSQSGYLNDEYRHMSEESPHTITTVTSPYHSQQVTSSFSQVNTVESKHKHNINNSKQSWNINVKVGHSQFNCIIDSGADLNIMSKQTFDSLKRQQSQMSLVKCHINVTGFCGKSIPIMGKVNIKCNLILNNNTVSENIVFIVANLVCPNVLGLPTCERLGIIKRVFSVSKQNFCQQILTQYNDVFQGLGCLPPVCHLKLKPDAVPCVDPPRRVPFAMLGKLREELDRMESMQVIEKVTKPTEWVNSIVITVKSSDHVREFSCGTLYYRTFFVDSKRDALYVGAMDRLYRLNMNNISASHCERDSINLEPSNVAQCVSKGKSEHFDCRNHVRVIQPMGDGSRLYVCGTNAHSPKDWVLYSNLTHLPRHEYVPGIGMGVAKCPYDPADNSTALWVERGNPGSLPALYSGTNAEFTKADTVIFRTDLHNLTTGRREFAFKRTLKYDSKWLDKPNFVGSFDVGDYVLFFFRETAVEYINCGKAVYSRVARVCKRDTGGKNILSQNWATYLKARLNCSIPGEFPFYFNEIQSIYKVPGDDSRFYGVFTTASTGLMGSAICTFTIGDIQKAFEGKFKEQASSSSAWLPVISSKVPEPRPGTCVNDTSSLPDTVLNFIRSHPLMDSAVSHENEKPIYYKRDLFFTRLVVDKVKVDMMGHQLEYTVYYAGTNEGKIHKIVQWNRNGDSQSALLDIFDVTPGEPIQAMAISRMHGSLYAASDRRVLQLRLALCARRYDACVRCARDPYCGWDRDAGVCREYMPGLIQDVANETADICDSSIARKSVSATWGQSLHLGSFVKMPEVLQPRAVTWYHYSREKGRHPITFNKPEKYIETSEHGLLIISVNEADAGRYDCWLGGSLLCSYNITVDTHRCSPPEKSNEYQKIYSNWCHEFEKYKTAMKTWERKQEQCSRQNDSNQNTHPNEIV